MTETIVFTLRLTSDDWDAHFRAWDCSAFDIPSAFIKEARDSKGQPIALSLLRIDKGPARVSWLGPGSPSQIALVVGFGEELSPTSEENFWKRLAIVVPIITALISGVVTYYSKPGPSDTHTLRLSVLPNDVDASGLPPAKITLNSQEVKQPVDYKVASDVIAIVDVNKAFKLAKTLNDATGSLVTKLDAVSQQVNQYTARVGGDICPGGGHGTPSPLSGSLSAQGAAISQKLTGITSELTATLETIRQ